MPRNPCRGDIQWSGGRQLVCGGNIRLILRHGVGGLWSHCRSWVHRSAAHVLLWLLWSRHVFPAAPEASTAQVLTRSLDRAHNSPTHCEAFRLLNSFANPCGCSQASARGSCEHAAGQCSWPNGSACSNGINRANPARSSPRGGASRSSKLHVPFYKCCIDSVSILHALVSIR